VPALRELLAAQISSGWTWPRTATNDARLATMKPNQKSEKNTTSKIKPERGRLAIRTGIKAGPLRNI
jgi:hypothetical protein